jgi:hypothetical protein
VILSLLLGVREFLVLFLLLVLFLPYGSGNRSRTPSLLGGELFVCSLTATGLAGGILGPSHTHKERGSLGPNDLHPYEIKIEENAFREGTSCARNTIFYEGLRSTRRRHCEMR